MVTYCCVCGRERSSVNPGITFHRFPKDPEKKKKWCEALGFHNFDYPTAVVCRDHFTNDDYRAKCDRPLLKTDAIPHRDPSFPNKIVRRRKQCNSSFAFDENINFDNIFLSDVMIESSDDSLTNDIYSAIEKPQTVSGDMPMLSDYSDDNEDLAFLMNMSSSEKSNENSSSEVNFDSVLNEHEWLLGDIIQEEIVKANEFIRSGSTDDKTTHGRKLESSTSARGPPNRYRIQLAEFGIIRKDDFKDESAWDRMLNYINYTRTEMRKMYSKNSELLTELNNFKKAMSLLREKNSGTEGAMPKV